MIKLKSLLVETDEQRKSFIVDNPDFKRWFDKSKIVDRDGNPILMYHARRSGGLTKLKPSMRNNAEATLLWFSSTSLTEYGSNVYKAYLKIENPISEKEYKEIETWGGRTVSGEMKKMGYDGIITVGAGSIIAGVIDGDQVYLIGD